MTNDIYYYKYLKYKEKYKKLTELCNNMEKYAVTMSENINSNGKNIKLIFNYLDNWNECYQEAANFLFNKDYNLQYLQNICIFLGILTIVILFSVLFKDQISTVATTATAKARETVSSASVSSENNEL
jgi:hypothetical protein